MTILKSIRDLDAWLRLARPTKPEHWQDGRSAKESARAWLEAAPDSIPCEIGEALNTNSDFGAIRPGWSAKPEAPVPFDKLGEPAHIDVLLLAEDNRGPFVVAVEAKADEPFGSTIEETQRAAAKRRAKNPRSKGVTRLEQLALAVLGVPGDRLPEVGELRYQLLTASAAALAEAQRRSAHRAVVIIHEFVTDQTRDLKHHRNAADLDAFVSKLSRGAVTSLAKDAVRGPFELPGHPVIDSPVRFYIGKTVRNLRSDDRQMRGSS